MSEPYPYEELHALGRGLYCMRGSWKKSPLGRRMTVIRSAGGELAIHGAIRLHEPDFGRIIDPLGRVALILTLVERDGKRRFLEGYSSLGV